MAIAGPVTASESPPPDRLVVRATPPEGRPGALIALSIRSPLRLASLRVAGTGAVARIEPDPSGRTFRGLLAIDLAREPGRIVLSIDGEDEDGGSLSTTWTLRVRPRKFRLEKLRVDPSLVEPPPDALPRIEAERERVASIWKAPDERRRWTKPFGSPVAAPPSGNFGVRRIFNGQERSRHTGVDFPAASGTPVVAPAPGRVALAEELYFSGGTIILDHGGGLFTSYFHLSRLDVARGDDVRAGQRLGAVGATGRATGPHLHWSARLEDARIDPLGLERLPSWPAP